MIQQFSHCFYMIIDCMTNIYRNISVIPYSISFVIVLNSIYVQYSVSIQKMREIISKQ